MSERLEQMLEDRNARRSLQQFASLRQTQIPDVCVAFREAQLAAKDKCTVTGRRTSKHTLFPPSQSHNKIEWAGTSLKTSLTKAGRRT